MLRRTHGQKGPSRAAMRVLFNLALGALMAHLGALVDGRTSRNAKYSSEALMRCLIHLSAKGAYAESGLGSLRDGSHRAPSPDTLF
ncbi:MAG: hypothetical protein C0167_03545 [Nitrososphaera sp.]|nr:MAG: hypothetical protein C0167_03545 [Nitrososphaera sp.]